MSVFRKKARHASGLTAIDAVDGRVCAIRLNPIAADARTDDEDRRYSLSLVDERAGETAEELGANLEALCRQHDLDATPCTTALDSNYKLILTEAPDVPADELRAALRWRVKDLIDGPVEETTFDTLVIPSLDSTQRARQIYVVAAENQALHARVDPMQEAGINLQVVDVAETALRNIAALLPEDASGVATLWLREDRGLLSLTRGGELYMSRNLSTGLSSLRRTSERAQAIEALALEIQRSLDYYESHYRLPPVRILYLAPIAGEIPELATGLRENIGIDTKPLILEQLIHTTESMPNGWQSRYLIAIGAAMRPGVTAS